MNLEKKSKYDKLMTGSYDVNNWLDGGFEKDIISCFYGPYASGKSNFMMLVSCHNAKKDKKVIFVDTEGGFSLDRIRQITGGLPEMVLKNIVLLKPTSFKEQKEAFLIIGKELKSKNIGLIVVDSMTMLYRLALADARKEDFEKVKSVNRDMNKMMQTLNDIARKQEIPVLITSQVYSEFLSEADWMAGKEAKVGVVGGDLIRYWCKCIIELQTVDGKKRAVIRKHRSLPEKVLNFDVVNEGIVKRGWL
jgi:DNA repair protein RadB